MKDSAHLSVIRSGFTLIELSIVLVIIGLVVGGVLVGGDLIDIAGKRSVISDIEKYQTSMQTFRVKYGCLPGDCNNATQFFGTANSDPVACQASTNTGTCNGDGDGRIGVLRDVTTATEYETFRVWQQLSLSGLLPATFAGSFTHESDWQKIGTHYPSTKWNRRLGYILIYLPAVTEWTYRGYYFYGSTGIGQFFRLWSYPPGWGCITPFIGSEDTRWFDTKLDDGVPDNGNVQTMKSGHGCAPNFNICNLTNPDTGKGIYPAIPSNNCPALFRVKI